MTKAYTSNLTQDQYELILPLLPPAKPGGRPREVCMWSVLNAIFYVVVNGCKWRDLPGDFPAWQTVYTYFRNWRLDGTWLAIHDRMRGWTRAVAGRPESPSEAVLDSQSVQTDTMVHEEVGFDAAKMSRDLLINYRLVLRVLVTAANVPEREGGKQVLKKVYQMGQSVSSLFLVWVDGGYSGNPFLQWVMDTKQLGCSGCVATGTGERLCFAQKTRSLWNSLLVGLIGIADCLKIMNTCLKLQKLWFILR